MLCTQTSLVGNARLRGSAESVGFYWMQALSLDLKYLWGKYIFSYSINPMIKIFQASITCRIKSSSSGSFSDEALPCWLDSHSYHFPNHHVSIMPSGLRMASRTPVSDPWNLLFLLLSSPFSKFPHSRIMLSFQTAAQNPLPALPTFIITIWSHLLCLFLPLLSVFIHYHGSP